MDVLSRICAHVAPRRRALSPRRGAILRLGVLSSILVVALEACGSTPVAPSPQPDSTPAPTPTPQPSPPIPSGPPSATVSAMLQALPSYITSAILENQQLLPNNPQNATLIQAKITMLQNPSLASEITTERRWAESTASRIPIAALFPLEIMRSEADLAVRTLEPVLPLLEEFLAVPFPAQAIRVWYGFKIGNTGGGGSIFSEDRTTYESRTPASRLPFDAILSHELGHSYIANESLTQFLELYTYNVIRTGSRNVSSWIYVRSWTPGLASNDGIHALLDIYQAIGFDEMSRGYRAIYPLRPPYGSPLSADVIQAFANQVSAAQRAFVMAKLARVTA